ncbi:hypothetical protein Poly30_53540 [Planctomycetes bacterium Poly30]|uniref:HEAT repeat protein n=1 Tax=Saltatorellus ferox TaxID=2528018 RepID=A0A518F0D5_9BACT|nr:hypothetical protein Poly30_53540 [Planctomycetes bacterium Poly30]
MIRFFVTSLAALLALAPPSASLQGSTGATGGPLGKGILCYGGPPAPEFPAGLPAEPKIGPPSKPAEGGSEAGDTGGLLGGASNPPRSPGPGAGPPIGTLDPLRWELWWRLERDEFLDLRDTVRRRHAMVTSGLSAVVRADRPPSRRMIDASVVPALLGVLSGEESDEMCQSALIALARIGGQGPIVGQGPFVGLGLGIEPALTAHLASRSQVVSETAALALGIFGEGTSFETLAELLDGTEAGAALLGRGEVPDRTRAFAAFGLGVLAFDTADVARQQEVAARLLDTLQTPSTSAEVPAAAMLALGQCKLPLAVTLPPAALRSHPDVEALVSSAGMARWLLTRLGTSERDSTITSPKERAFCLTTLAKFASDRDAALRDDVQRRLRTEASDRRRSSDVRSAALVALGELARSGKGEEDEASIRFLERMMATGQPMERRFAAMSLAQASARAGFGDDPFQSASAAAQLLRTQSRKGSCLERPWAALALGVQAFQLHQASAGAPGVPAPARVLLRRKELLAELANQRNVTTIGAYALGAALLHKGADPAARGKAGEVMLEAFRRIGEPEAKGYLALALGLVGHEPAKDALLDSLRESLSRPDLCWHLSVGLGLIGDVRLTPTLVEALIAAKSHGTRAAIAVSLGSIGDRRAVDPLLALVEDRSMPSATRSMAIVGVGILCEESALPWRNPMAHALPYSAMTSTLGGQYHAIFDIL